MVDEERMLPPELPVTYQLTIFNHNEVYEEVKRAQARSPQVRRDIRLWHDIHLRGPQNRKEETFLLNYTVEDDILFYQEGEDKKLVVPRRKLKKVIHLHHDQDDAAHPGVDETLRAIKQLYHAKKLRSQVSNYVKKCLPCHAIKVRQIQRNAPQRPHTARSPFEVLSVDVLGPYPMTPRDNRFIFIVEDLFTKWVEAKAVPEAEAKSMCQFLEEDVFSRYGYPNQIISDNGTVFHSNRYLNLCRRHDIQPYYTAVYFHRENPVERKVADFKTVLRALTYSNHLRRAWDTKIHDALRVIRSRNNRAIGETPAKALLGYDIAKKGQWDIPEFQRRRRRPREDARARRQVIRAREVDFQRQNYPQQNELPAVTFQIGDRVMVRDRNPPGPFAPAWTGPYEVIVRHSPFIFEVDKNGRQYRFHVDQLRPAPPGNPLPLQDESSSDDGDESDREDQSSSAEELGAEGPLEPGADLEDLPPPLTASPSPSTSTETVSVKSAIPDVEHVPSQLGESDTTSVHTSRHPPTASAAPPKREEFYHLRRRPPGLGDTIEDLDSDPTDQPDHLPGPSRCQRRPSAEERTASPSPTAAVWDLSAGTSAVRE